MRIFVIAWLAVVLKLFLPALLIFFLVIRPLAGTGYGVWYTLLYLFVLCPCFAALLYSRAVKRRHEQNVERKQL